MESGGAAGGSTGGREPWQGGGISGVSGNTERQAVATAQGVTQERLNNTQRELRAALAQNQKYEEVVSQWLVWLGF